MTKVSVIIPSKNERHLDSTINDVLSKAEEEIEVIVILDGYWVNKTVSNVIYLHKGKSQGMRSAINSGVAIATGEFIMKLDAHCMLDKGFDVKLKKYHQDNWIQIPTRKRLDAENWKIKDDPRPDINYMKLDDENRGRLWNRKGREHIMLDDIIAFQGSCYFMKKQYFQDLCILDEVNYDGCGHEAQEIALKCWFSGGRVVRNKHTWYAHWHKEKEDLTFSLDRTKSREYFKDWVKPYTEQLQALKSVLHSDDHKPLSFVIAPCLNTITPKNESSEYVDNLKKLQNKIKEKSEMSKTPITDTIVEKFSLEKKIGKPMQIEGMGRKQMFEFFAELGFNVGAEVGVQRGRNAQTIFESIPFVHMWLIDPYDNHNFGYRRWDKETHDRFKKQSTDRLKDDWVIDWIYKFSEDAWKEIPDESLDFIYIDGDHSYDFVMFDILVWLRKVKPGGIISGHDYFYNNQRQSSIAKVTSAVNDYTRIHKIPFFITDKTKELHGDHFPSWFWVKENTPKYNKDKDKIKVGIVQYTDNFGDQNFLEKCRQQIKVCAEENNISEIVCVSHKPVEDFGKNIVVNYERGVLAMFKQVVDGIEACDADVIYLAEHDMIYHPSHFSFIPPEKDVFYYDRNRYSVCDETGKAVFYHTDVPSMMCAYKDFLLDHYKRRVQDLESKDGKWDGKNGYSPPKGLPKNKRKGTRQTYIAKFPSLDVRRKDSWTRKRMNKKQFRSEKSHRGWKELDILPGWGIIKDRFNDFVNSLGKTEESKVNCADCSHTVEGKIKKNKHGKKFISIVCTKLDRGITKFTYKKECPEDCPIR